MKDTAISAADLRVGGAPEGFDAKIVAQLARDHGGPVLHIALDDRRAAALADALAFFAPDLAVLRFPAWDCTPYDRISPNAEITAHRMATLAALADGLAAPSIILATVNAAMLRTPEREDVRGGSWAASVGQRVDVDGLTEYLVRAGFNRASTVGEPGDFALRGGIVDIFPPGAESPVRLDFFGDVLDGARRFDAESQRTLERIERVELAPATEAPLDPASITRFRQKYREMFGAAGLDDPLYEAVSAGRKHQGMEHWAPLLHDRMETIFDFLPGAPIALDHRTEDAAAARWTQVEEHFNSRSAAARDRAMGQPVYKAPPPAGLYLSPQELERHLKGRPVRRMTPHAQPPGPGVIDMGARQGRNFAPERLQDGVNVFDALSDHIRDRRAKGRVVIAAYSDGARDRLSSMLADHGVEGAATAGRWSEVEAAPKGALRLVTWPLEAGFVAGDLTVVSEQDILGERLIRKTRKRKTANFIAEAGTLSAGDLVVHVEHGVGRYTGMKTVTALGARHECLELEYAGETRLYLPVENIELLSRYGHADGMLDRLGGGAWQAKKAQLKERIRDMAEKLIRVAAERMLREAPKFNPPEGMWDEFCARFPYQETDDQLHAIEDVLEDLAAGRPMDRLICGDVGFGKTEVALRAALIVAMSGVQVALICPTTLLARQHAAGFRERFKGTPLKVRQLSRFVNAKDAEATRQGLADGTVDIVIGTHALLAKSVKFRDLGLLIIDEEQHFGVSHKERLKRLRSDVHVLTMTATPIPRTLQMSMSGVRELSLIATPPVDRLAVRTYVAPFDSVTVREALLRERYRGGQCFYVVPRVSDIAAQEEFLRNEVPEVSFITCHGQMAAGELDRRMNAFYDGEYDVLLATTIIESGLDIPAANTLIVHRADMFGLAQLYQIRGRVGRSKVRAYAYFTTEPRKPLTPAADKRLKVLSSLDSLGAGFTLASHDMDIRGAGNLLGEEQSGHIREVGYELYQEMLEETIAKLRSGALEGLTELEETWSPKISLGVTVLIPEDYVSDLDLRLGLYRRLSGLETRTDLEGFAAELHDRFGKPPAEVETLLRIVRIKTMCRRAGIEKLDAGERGCVIQFRGDKIANPSGLVEFIEAERGRAKIRDNKVIIRREWSDEAVKMKGAFAVARDLAKALAPAK
ncbi:MAG: transcription-repair coupling factor [Paracoccaceae bacterium]